VKTRLGNPWLPLGLLVVALVVAKCKGDAGEPGAAGATGDTGPTGPAGPSATTQVLATSNLSLSLTCATPTVITSLPLTGPAVYLITASGFLFSNGGTQVQVNIDFYRDASQLAHGEMGALVNATSHVEESYSYSRLVNVSGATATIQIRGCRTQGDGTPVVFSNSINGTRVGTGTGAQLQSVEMRPAFGRVGPPR
jgi:hypothetical protein